MDVKIESVLVKDIRFPTGKDRIGSDAMNPDPDYSAAYVILQTNHPGGFEGHGLTFTIGPGTEICVRAVQSLSGLVIGKDLNTIVSDMAGFWRMITGDSQYRWLGPDKGVIHLATSAIVNAVWDLYAKMEQKPLWKLIGDMAPDQIMGLIDFSYISDAITREEARTILEKNSDSRQQRIEELEKSGYPAYTTSAGWFGFDDAQIRHACRKAVDDGWKYVKMKVGSDIADNIRRATVIKNEIGKDARLLMDANQKWDVADAIEHIRHLARFDPWWIEEPTHPDDILGHKKIADAVRPVKIASGEHAANRLIFKQFITSRAIDFCQIDNCRLGGVNEVLAVMLMAAKYGIPVCPHAGGVGLCEYVQHLSIIDYICVSASKENRLIEYVDHLHEHFIDPVRIKNGAYIPPQMPGFSIQMKPDSIRMYEYPNGTYWQQNNS